MSWKGKLAVFIVYWLALLLAIVHEPSTQKPKEYKWTKNMYIKPLTKDLYQKR